MISLHLKNNKNCLRDLQEARKIIKKLNQEKKKLQEELKIAGIDRSTGLMLGNLFRKKVENILNSFFEQRDERKESKFDQIGIVFFDLNNLKKINEQYGHQTGDEALYVIAELIQDQLRDFNFVSRWGGDEIVLCLIGANEIISAKIAERINGALQNKQVSLKYSELRISVSVGVTSCHKNDQNINVEKLIEKADQAASMSKNIFRTENKIQVIKYSDLKNND